MRASRPDPVRQLRCDVDETARRRDRADDEHPVGPPRRNEYDLRELCLIRNGERTDVTIGRQYVLDLAAVKSTVSASTTRARRQLTTSASQALSVPGLALDHDRLVDLKAPTDGRQPAGSSAPAGSAPRIERRRPTAHSAVSRRSVGGGAPRVFGTANGYWRVNPKLDIYHYALIDLVSVVRRAAHEPTGGVNYKPTQRLRMTASYNRVDTETLNIQAGAYLDTQGTNQTVNNEAFVARLATNEARGTHLGGTR